MADKDTDMGLRTSLLFGAAVTLALSLGAAGADAKDGKGAGGGSKAGASSSSSANGKKAGNNNSRSSLNRAEQRAAASLNDRQEAKLNGLLRQISAVENRQDALGTRKAGLQDSLKDARKQGERNRIDRLRDRLGDLRTAQQREADRKATLRDRVRNLLGLPPRGTGTGTGTGDGTTDPAATGPTPLILAYGSGGNGNYSVGAPTPLVPEGERLVITGVGSGGQSGGNSFVAPISP